MANRQIIFYKHYFNEFYIELKDDVRTKLKKPHNHKLLWLKN